MRQLSKLLLLVQAPFLAYLTLLGLLLCTGAIFEDLSGAVVGVIILSAVLAGWRIWFWVMADGPAEHKSIHRSWWLFASMGIALTVLSYFTRLISQFTNSAISIPYQDLFLLGAYFAPSLLHIVLEIWWQRRANKSFKPTPQSGAA